MWDLVVSVPDHCLSFYFSSEGAPKVARRKAILYNDTYLASFKDFNVPPESYEQIAHARAKWRCPIRKVADDCAKRGCEAERKRKDRKPEPKDRHQSRHFQN